MTPRVIWPFVSSLTFIIKFPSSSICSRHTDFLVVSLTLWKCSLLQAFTLLSSGLHFLPICHVIHSIISFKPLLICHPINESTMILPNTETPTSHNQHSQLSLPCSTVLFSHRSIVYLLTFCIICLLILSFVIFCLSPPQGYKFLKGRVHCQFLSLIYIVYMYTLIYILYAWHTVDI